MFSRGALLLLTAALAWGQGSVEVSGRILESGTTVGIEGVHIDARSFDGNALLRAEATTSPSGSFRLSLPQAGAWSIAIKKDGYTLADGSMMGVNVTREAPPQDLRYFMQRGAIITGRVEDADAREPVEGLPLAVTTAATAGELVLGGYVLTAPPNTRTDGEGKFVHSNTPGSWLVRVFPRVSVGRVRTEFKPEDIDKIDEDYEDSYWPGGFDKNAAVPLVVASGTSGDFGTLHVRKTKYYRVHVSFPAERCQAGARFQGRITRPSIHLSSQMMVREVEFLVVCGQDLLITALKPGSYSVEIYPEGAYPEQQLWSLTPFEITRENARVKVTLSRGPDLEGRFVAAEGAGKLPFEDLHGSLAHVGWSAGAERRDFDADAEGRFHVTNVPLARWYAGFLNSGPQEWILSDVRFRGVSMPRNLLRPLAEFTWDGSGAIEIVLDDKPGSVRGTVTDNGKPAAGAIVLLYPLPLPPGGYTSTFAERQATARSDGSFLFDRLPAGEYQLFSVGRLLFGGRGRILSSFPAGSVKVAVPRGGAASADLRLIPDPK